MGKIIFILIFISSLLIAKDSDFATKEDIKMLDKKIDTVIELVKENNKVLIEMIKNNNENINKRFESVDKRFEDMNKRFEDMNKRFEDMNDRFNELVLVMIAGFTLIFGYLLKERSIIANKVKDEIEPEILKKADKSTLDKVIAILEDLAKKDKEVKQLFIKHGLTPNF